MHIQISGFPRSNESRFFQPDSSLDSLVTCLHEACLGTSLFSEFEVSVGFGRPGDGFDTTILLIEVFGLELGFQVEDMLSLLRTSFYKVVAQHLTAPGSMGRFPWEVIITFSEEECLDLA